jgi:hypothetical protein
LITPRTDFKEDVEAGLPHEAGEPIAQVSAADIDGVLQVTITPKEEYTWAFDPATEFTLKFTSPERQATTKAKINRIYQDILTVVLGDFYRSRLKAPLVFPYEQLMAKMQSRERGIKLFSHLCQKGSPYHCTILLRAVSKLITECFENPDLSTFFLGQISASGFPRLAAGLPSLITHPDRKDELLEMINFYLREILGKYATTYTMETKVETVPDEEIEKSRAVAKEACKRPLFELVPKPYDESDMMAALSETAEAVTAEEKAEAAVAPKAAVTAEDPELVQLRERMDTLTKRYLRK